MASAEGESVRSVVGYGEGCPKPTRGSGERRELSQRGPGQSAGRKRILAYFEGHRQNLGGGAICISITHSRFWGTCPPSPPVIYAHAVNDFL